MNYNKLPVVIKNTVDYNTQSLLDYKFYDANRKMKISDRDYKNFNIGYSKNDDSNENDDSTIDLDLDSNENSDLDLDLYNDTINRLNTLNNQNKINDISEINVNDDVIINDFQYFMRPEFEHKIYERNSCYGKIYFNLNYLSNDFDIIIFINDFNQYLKTVKYVNDIDFKEYKKMIKYYNQNIISNNNNNNEY